MSGPAEVEAWLTLRGHGAAAAGACRALRNVRVPEREWIGELIGMEHDGSLGAFLGGIEEKSVAHSPPSGLPPVVVPPSGRGSASSRGARSMAAVLGGALDGAAGNAGGGQRWPSHKAVLGLMAQPPAAVSQQIAAMPREQLVRAAVETHLKREPEPEPEPTSAQKAVGVDEASAEVEALKAKVQAFAQQKAALAQAKQFREAGNAKKQMEAAERLLRQKETRLAEMTAARAQEAQEADGRGQEAAVQRPDTQEATLPDGWELRPSKEYPGRSFYFHAATSKSQWERPAPDTRAAALEEEGIPPPRLERFIEASVETSAEAGKKVAQSDARKRAQLVELKAKLAAATAELAASELSEMLTDLEDVAATAKGLRKLGGLARNQQPAQRALVAAGGAEVVVSAMTGHADDEEVQINGCSAMWDLVCNAPAHATIAAGAGSIAAICAAIASHRSSAEVQVGHPSPCLRNILRRICQIQSEPFGCFAVRRRLAARF